MLSLFHRWEVIQQKPHLFCLKKKKIYATIIAWHLPWLCWNLSRLLKQILEVLRRIHLEIRNSSRDSSHLAKRWQQIWKWTKRWLWERLTTGGILYLDSSLICYSLRHHLPGVSDLMLCNGYVVDVNSIQDPRKLRTMLGRLILSLPSTYLLVWFTPSNQWKPSVQRRRIELFWTCNNPWWKISSSLLISLMPLWQVILKQWLFETDFKW